MPLWAPLTPLSCDPLPWCSSALHFSAGHFPKPKKPTGWAKLTLFLLPKAIFWGSLTSDRTFNCLFSFTFFILLPQCLKMYLVFFFFSHLFFFLWALSTDRFIFFPVTQMRIRGVKNVFIIGFSRGWQVKMVQSNDGETFFFRLNCAGKGPAGGYHRSASELPRETLSNRKKKSYKWINK